MYAPRTFQLNVFPNIDAFSGIPGWFATKIFHPNVSTAGEICVNTLKKDWKSTYGIGHILVTVKCLLIYPNPESALDEEAGKLLLEDYNSYCERARLITSVHATPKVRAPSSQLGLRTDLGAGITSGTPSRVQHALKYRNSFRTIYFHLSVYRRILHPCPCTLLGRRRQYACYYDEGYHDDCRFPSILETFLHRLSTTASVDTKHVPPNRLSPVPITW